MKKIFAMLVIYYCARFTWRVLADQARIVISVARLACQR